MKAITIADIPENKDLQVFLEDFIIDGNFAISIVYESVFGNTPKLRFLMEKLLDIYDIELKDRNRLVLVSDELNNNAVEHGTGDCGENIIEINVKKQSADTIYINIEVTDCGEGNAESMEVLKKEKELNGFDNHRSIRGRGLFLITEKIVDRLYFRDSSNGGLTVGIEKTL